MEGEARVRELAEMTSGKAITETALAQARELLETGQPQPRIGTVKLRSTKKVKA
jgi:hypothetical protein